MEGIAFVVVEEVYKWVVLEELVVDVDDLIEDGTVIVVVDILDVDGVDLLVVDELSEWVDIEAEVEADKVEVELVTVLMVEEIVVGVM